MKLFSGLLLCLLFTFSGAELQAQTTYTPPPSKEMRSSTGVWFGIYTKYNFSDKWAYYGEYHIRRREGLDQMAQIYLRVGATYKISKYLDVTLGFANPYYWAPNPEDNNIDEVVPQYRAWEQLVLATPFDHIKVLHQLRFEQRWKRDFVKDSPFKLTYRYRYKLTIYVPLNHKDFGPTTLFLSMYEEIFIQSGKSVIYDHFEDNRTFLGLGYNFNETLQIQAGYMYSFRHDGAPHKYENRSILRFSIYHHLDFHLEKPRKAQDIPIH